MSTATLVPETYELEGDDALETLPRTGWWRLLKDSFRRFRYADGFSHSRALAFQVTLSLLPAIIAVVGLATLLHADHFRKILGQAATRLAPGPAGDVVVAAFRHGQHAVGGGALSALVLGLLAAMLFRESPRRHQPAASWLASGSAMAVLLGFVFTGLLSLYLGASRTFGQTYGPLAGLIGVLVWALLTSMAIFFGLAFAAQLEAVRAGVASPITGQQTNAPGSREELAHQRDALGAWR